MREDLKKGNLIVQLSFEFAVEVVTFCAKLEADDYNNTGIS